MFDWPEAQPYFRQQYILNGNGIGAVTTDAL